MSFFTWCNNMRWRKIKDIFKKEILDTLRDRRTIMMMIVIPVLLYPGLMILLNEVAATQQAKLEQKTVKIAVVNSSDDSRLIEQIRKAEHVQLVSSKKPFEDVRSGKDPFRGGIARESA